MANGLAPASSHLQTPNPPQAQAGQGALSGWAGIIGSGLATIAGVASGNDYLVGFGGGAADSYRKSYEEFNSNLMSEQRANRLADADMMRQQHFAQFQRDMTAEDRAFEQGLAEEEMALKGRQEDRLETQSQSSIALQQAQLAEVQKTPEQRAQEQLAVQELLADAADARTAGQKKKQIAQLRELGVPDSTIKLVELQHAGLDVSKLMGQKGAQFTAESYTKVQQEAADQFKTTPKYKELVADSGQTAADMAAAEIGAATADLVRQSFGGGGGTDITTLTGGAGGGGGETVRDLDRAINLYNEGIVTEDQIRAGAETDEEKAAVEAAIKAKKEKEETDTPAPAPPPEPPSALYGVPEDPAAAAGASWHEMSQAVTPQVEVGDMTPNEYNRLQRKKRRSQR